MNLGGWIIGAIVTFACLYIVYLIFVREQRIKNDEKTVEQVEREIQRLALKALSEPRHGRRDVA